MPWTSARILVFQNEPPYSRHLFMGVFLLRFNKWRGGRASGLTWYLEVESESKYDHRRNCPFWCLMSNDKDILYNNIIKEILILAQITIHIIPVTKGTVLQQYHLFKPRYNCCTHETINHTPETKRNLQKRG